MKKYNLKNIVNIILLLFICFATELVLASDNSNLERDHYLKLCAAYKHALSMNSDLSSKEMWLAEKVQTNLPKLFDALFVHIIKADSNIRYKLIKDFAKQQNNFIWKCDSANKYYASNFR